MKDSLSLQLTKGQKFCKYLLYVIIPLFLFFLTGLIIYILTYNIAKWLHLFFLFFFLIYLALTPFCYLSGSRLMLLIMFAGAGCSIILMISNIILMMTYIPNAQNHMAIINLSSPWNYLLPILTIVLFMLYFFKKQMQINIVDFKEELRRKKLYDEKNHTYYIGSPPQTIGGFYQKRKEKYKFLTKSKKIKAFIFDLFGWVIMLAYYILPAFAITYNQLWHGKPISWICLFGSYFFIYIYSIYCFQQSYVYFRVYQQVEKKLGNSLRPIRD